VPSIKLKNAAMTRIGRLDADYRALVREVVAAVAATHDLGAVSRVLVSSFAPAELCGIDDAAGVVREVLRSVHPGWEGTVEGPARTGGEALWRALSTWRSGGGDALLVGCEKMTHVEAGAAAGLLAPRVANPVEQRHGATLPALGALVTQAYTGAWRVPFRAFHRVAVKNHRHAARNPLAHFQRELSEDDVARSPLVADPLRRGHCAPMSDGAVACLLGEGAGDVRVRSHARGLDAAMFHDRRHLGRFEAVARAAHEAFAAARVRPADIDVVEIHDAFAPFELLNLEEMGFFAHGTAWRALDAGALEVGGRLAVNPSGGMKARGHPIGVCGLTSVAEMAEQLAGRARARQQPAARLGVVQSAGGVSRDTYLFVLEAA
jgi:acetyl-CoA C-acetyltransferase